MEERKSLERMLAVHEARNAANGGKPISRTMAAMEATIRRALAQNGDDN